MRFKRYVNFAVFKKWLQCNFSVQKYIFFVIVPNWIFRSKDRISSDSWQFCLPEFLHLWCNASDICLADEYTDRIPLHNSTSTIMLMSIVLNFLKSHVTSLQAAQCTMFGNNLKCLISILIFFTLQTRQNWSLLAFLINFWPLKM